MHSPYNHNKRICEKRSRAFSNAMRHPVRSRKWNKWMNRWVKLANQLVDSKLSEVYE